MAMANAARARRLVYLVHRWTGVAGCLLMALWLVSGVVMLYVGYPKLLPRERLSALPPLPAGCCVPVEAALAASGTPAAIRELTLTSIAGRPAYRLKDAGGAWQVVDARTGRRAPAVDAAFAAASARAFLPGAAATVQGQVDDDRWTHSGALDAHRPLFRVRMHDAASTRLYVSSATGEVVMDATRAERGWNRLGAWLHWLYMFREGSKDAAWSWLVIALSAVCTASAATGAVVGVWRWRFAGRYRSGARTPYRGFHMRWHHVTGLLFGAVLLAWIFSGLMSMNPLGVFDAGTRPDLAAYRQGTPGALRPRTGTADALAALRDAGFAAREVEWRVLAGRPYLLARDAAGDTRLVTDAPQGPAVTARLADDVLAAAGARLFAAGVRGTQWLQAHDAYYYPRGAASMYGARDRRLPVLRLDFDDAGRTAAYLDPRTGDLALSVDRSQRAGRWLFNFLHSWDLPSFLGMAAAREAALIALSLGALAIALTGTVIGVRRLAAQLWLRRGAGHRRAPRAPRLPPGRRTTGRRAGRRRPCRARPGPRTGGRRPRSSARRRCPSPRPARSRPSATA